MQLLRIFFRRFLLAFDWQENVCWYYLTLIHWPTSWPVTSFFALRDIWVTSLTQCKVFVIISRRNTGKNKVKEATKTNNNGSVPINVEVIKSIFAEMFKQQEKILMETKSCFYIQQPKYGTKVWRTYI